MAVDIDRALHELVDVLEREVDAREEARVLDVDKAHLLAQQIVLDLLTQLLLRVKNHNVAQAFETLVVDLDLHELLDVERFVFVH